MLPELLVSDITKTQLVFQAHAGTDITQANALSFGIITDETEESTILKIEKDEIFDSIEKALRDSHIPFETIKDGKKKDAKF